MQYGVPKRPLFSLHCWLRLVPKQPTTPTTFKATPVALTRSIPFTISTTGEMTGLCRCRTRLQVAVGQALLRPCCILPTSPRVASSPQISVVWAVCRPEVPAGQRIIFCSYFHPAPAARGKTFSARKKQRRPQRRKRAWRPDPGSDTTLPGRQYVLLRHGAPQIADPLVRPVAW